MNMHFIFILISLMPFFAYAAPANFAGFANLIMNIANDLALLAVAAAFAAFLWGVARSILYSDSADEREKGKKIMAYGLISLFIVSALWGIMIVVGNTFFGGFVY